MKEKIRVVFEIERPEGYEDVIPEILIDDFLRDTAHFRFDYKVETATQQATVREEKV